MIELCGIRKHFNGVTAVDGIDYCFEAGKVTGLLGPNGAGKSTSIRMIMGILLPDAGSITAGGQAVSEALRDRFGYLPEERGLYKRMRVLDHLVFFASLKGLSRAPARQRGMEWLERLGLAAWAAHRVEDLSKGMQQKIQFAGTLLHDPDLILMDEPFAGLDPINTNALEDIVLELKAAGRTIIFSTHQMDNAERLCDQIALINRGRLVLAGSLREIRAAHGRGRLQVRYRGDQGVMAEDRRVLSFHGRGDGEAELELASEEDAPGALRDWSARLDITHFELVTPRLHDIFIRTVSAQAGSDHVAGGAP